MNRIARLLPVAAVVLAAGPAHAHLVGASGAGFAAGVAHPFGGLDHELAMVAVGLWAAQVGGRAAWVLPLAFPAVMLLGAVLGYAGLPLPLVELGIAASVAVLGAAVATRFRPSLALATAIVGAFAVLHGHAHGTELPEAARPALYMAGFTLATVALHGIGIGAGLLAGRLRAPALLRLGGSAIAAAGVAMALGVG